MILHNIVARQVHSVRVPIIFSSSDLDRPVNIVFLRLIMVHLIVLIVLWIGNDIVN